MNMNMVLNNPAMPDSTSIFQQMIDNFGTAGTVAIAVIGAAVSLGVIVILGMYGWRLYKHWLFMADSNRPENANQYDD
jgi:hypothetical protein